MSKYIDADRLKAEIERRIELICTTEGLVRRDKLQEYETLRDIEDFITSLQQEQPEVDLKEKIHRFIRAYFKNPDYDRDFIAEVDWESSMNECARHFYELGLNARKEK